MDELKARIARLTPERREALRRLAPEDYAALVAAEAEADGDETETRLLEIWTEVLGVPAGRDDNYFELGGDSILSVSIVAKARAAGMSLTPRMLFAYPTVAALAQALRREAEHAAARSDAADAAGPAQAPTARDVAPLTPLQQGLVFHTLHDAGSAAYVSQLSCVLPDTLDRARVADAWSQVTRRHDILRAAVDLGDPLAPRLRVYPDAPPVIEYRALAGDTAEEVRRSLDAFLQADLEREFDLAAPCLMRLTLLESASGGYRCVWTHHHLLLDGWSQLIVLQEFQALYLGASLPPVSTSFVDYAAWLAGRQGEDTERFWRGYLQGALPTRLPLLPASGPEAAAQARQASIVVRFDPRALDLQGAAQRLRMSAAVLLEAAWALTVGRLADRRDVCFGLTATVRPPELVDSDRVVGLCINTLPMRVAIPAEGGVSDWLASLQASQSDWLHHAHASLPDALRWAQVPKDLFDTLLVFENLPRLAGGDGSTPVHGMEDIRSTVREHYPMVLVTTPGESIVAELKFRPDAVPRARAELAMAIFESALGGLLEASDMAELAERVEATVRSRTQAARQERSAEDRRRLLGARRVPVTGDGSAE